MNGNVAILDAGAQYCKVIDRRVRELNVHSEILPLDSSLDDILEKGYKAIIISGGPESVLDSDNLAFDRKILEGRLPVLGICYGMQLINYLSGGKVDKAHTRRDGQSTIRLDTSSPLFCGLQSEEVVLLTHEDRCTVIAEGFLTIAVLDDYVVAMSKPELNLYGVQFHPEVDLTAKGKDILSNFLFKIAGFTPNFRVEDRLDSCIERLQNVVGERKVLFLLSGGVDSTVCAAIAQKALKPEQICAVHINNGFLRKNESESILEALSKLGLNAKYVNASLRFYSGVTTYQVPVDTSALAPASLLCKATQGANAAGETAEHPRAMEVDNNENNADLSPKVIHGGVVPYHEIRNIPIGPLNLHVVNPEEKRKIIGDVFIRVAEETWQDMKLNPEEFLFCQGTLRPDLIESASTSVTKKADLIKTHHNVSDLVKKLSQEGRVIEPLADFHKDEVRSIGRLLGLPEEVVERHPFPGPGLAVRILCANEPFVERDFPETTSLIKMIAGYSAMSQKANYFYFPHALLSKINSAINSDEQRRLNAITAGGALAAQILPIRSVGVQGDCRSYNYVCVVSSDKEPDWRSLFFIAQIIPRICHNINRVVFAFGSQIKFSVSDVTVTYLREPVIETLREVDARVNAVLLQEGCMRRVAQIPVVLIPIHFDRDPANMMAASSILRSVVLRPFITSDFMTGLPAMPGVDLPLQVVEKIVKAAEEVAGISRVLYDMTAKPPATIEWE
uniref:GMP synthase (glutamine-hydrolyzing) n=1 Tax=Echinococcus granulosus TaxID=6210 RepID=A0A068WYR8_ECHGR|nr:GMP synthase glutamine hydrolyzing [Echinococcus granulosus]